MMTLITQNFEVIRYVRTQYKEFRIKNCERSEKNKNESRYYFIKVQN